jgi:hypothetical protein
MNEQKARFAGLTLGTIAGFVALATVISGFTGCQQHEDDLAAKTALSCIEHGGQWIAGQCVRVAG